MAMANTASSRQPHRAGLLLLAAVLPASAAQWDIKPSLDVSGRYTDNVRLGVGGGSQAAFITEIAPQVSIVGKSGHGSELNLLAGVQGLAYSHDSSSNTFNPILNGRLRSEPVEDLLFLDATAEVRFQDTNRTSPVGGGNYYLTDNLTETHTLSVTPSLRTRFGHTANGEARLGLRYSSSDGGTISDTSGTDLFMGLTSGTAFLRMPWSVSYRHSQTDNGNTRDETQTVNLYTGYLVSAKTEFGFNIGYDKNTGSQRLEDLGGSFWNLALKWNPTTRTGLSATVGRRYDGNSYGLSMTHRSRQSAWGLNYSESINDTFSQLTATDYYDIYECPAGSGRGYPVPAGSPPPSPVCRLSTPSYPLQSARLVDDTTLTKTWSGVYSHQFGKRTLSLRLYATNREVLKTGSTDDSIGVSGSWDWQLGARTRSSLNLALSSNTVDAQDSDYWSASWVLSRQFTPHASGSVELRHQEQQGSTTVSDYTENSVAARVNMTF